MTAVWIASGVVLLAIVSVSAFDALRRPGDQRDPEQPTNVEKLRPQSEAAAAGARHDQLSEKDAADAEELSAWHAEISAEHPLVGPAVHRRHVHKPPSARQQAAIRARALAPLHAFAADPLAAPIPGQHRAEEPRLFAAEAERWFAPALAAAPRAFPDLPAEPLAFEAEGPTGVFPKDWIAQVMAAAEQKASAR